MPRAPARIRKRFIEGETVVLDWELEEALLRGQSMFGPLGTLQRRDDWRCTSQVCPRVNQTSVKKEKVRALARQKQPYRVF
jgi:hypothetical protein